MNFENICNNASYAAIQCNKNRVKANQINQLLTIYNTNLKKHIDNTIMLITAFVMKQRERGYFGNESSGAIVSALKEFNKVTDNEDKKNQVRDYLGLLKWFFEVADKIHVNWDVKPSNGFNSIVEDFQKAVSKKRS